MPNMQERKPGWDEILPELRLENAGVKLALGCTDLGWIAGVRRYLDERVESAHDFAGQV